MAAKLTRLTHKTAIQLHLVAESCTICSSRSRRPVRKLLVTPSCIWFPRSFLFYRKLEFTCAPEMNSPHCQGYSEKEELVVEIQISCSSDISQVPSQKTHLRSGVIMMC
jgi:hypothetical protein